MRKDWKPPFRKLKLTCASSKQRLDKFLVEAIPDLSRNQAQQLIKTGQVEAEGFQLKAGTLLPAATEVTVILPAAKTTQLIPQPMSLDILFEDDTIIALNKATGLVVHPAVGHTQDTLVNGLLHHYPPLEKLHHSRPGIAHRLDKDTSGVMVIAKTEAALQDLQRQFKARTVGKIYLALVHGIPQAPQGIIDVPLGRHPQKRQLMAPLAEGKAARTHYKTLQVFDDYSLLELKLETGRTHQIRVHLAWLGNSVVGDTVYGRRKNKLGLKRQFLHASRLSFTHPVTKEALSFEAPLPDNLATVLAVISN